MATMMTTTTTESNVNMCNFKRHKKQTEDSFNAKIALASFRLVAFARIHKHDSIKDPFDWGIEAAERKQTTIAHTHASQAQIMGFPRKHE